MQAEVTHSETRRELFGFNRAKKLVLEAGDPPRRRTWRPGRERRSRRSTGSGRRKIVAKTGGLAEIEAFSCC